MCCIPEQTNLFSDGAFGKGLLLDCQFNQCLNWTNYGRMRQKRKNQVWIWIALCRKTRQVVARAIGDRSEKTCQELWDNIPDEYRKGHCFADFWKAYQAVIPEEQLTQVGKETGETAHVERWNCTLRQRLGLFVRETFSFSKIMPMHVICLDLFLHRYNLDRAILLD